MADWEALAGLVSSVVALITWAPRSKWVSRSLQLAFAQSHSTTLRQDPKRSWGWAWVLQAFGTL